MPRGPPAGSAGEAASLSSSARHSTIAKPDQTFDQGWARTPANDPSHLPKTGGKVRWRIPLQDILLRAKWASDTDGPRERRHPCVSRLEAVLVAANRGVNFIMMAVMATLVFANVICRYVFNFSIIWAEEVS
jgi:hypothetical protein